MVEGRTVAAPPELISAYEDALRPFAKPAGPDQGRLV
jgi:hypothetical protein